jgi:hypothetical protein
MKVTSQVRSPTWVTPTTREYFRRFAPLHDRMIIEFERPAHFATRDKGRGMTCGLDFRCDAKNGGTEVSGKLWMEPRGPLRGLMLLMRLMMKRALNELPDNLRRVIEAQR